MPSFSSPSNGDLLHHLFINLYYTGIWIVVCSTFQASADEWCWCWRIIGHLKDPTTHFHLSRESSQCTNFLSQEDNIGYFHVKNQFPQLRPHPSPSCLLSYQRLQNEDEVIISNSKFSTLSYIYPSRASLTKVIEPSPCVKCPVPALPSPPHGFAPEATHNFPGDSLEQHITLHITQQKYWIHF